jgi:hypothetical protein
MPVLRRNYNVRVGSMLLKKSFPTVIKIFLGR